MLRLKSIIVLSIIGFLAQGTFAAEEDFLGRWAITLADPSTTFRACWLEVNRDGGQLSANLLWRRGSVNPAKSVQISGNEIQVTMTEGSNNKTYDVVYKASLEYGRLIGMVERPREEPACFWGRPALEAATDVSGTWDVAIQQGDQKRIHDLTLVQKGELILGLMSVHGVVAQVKTAKLEGNRLSVTFDPLRVEGHGQELKLNLEVRGDRAEGKAQIGDAPELTATAQRQRVWGAPVNLFNGKDLSNWVPRDLSVTPKWEVQDGLMVNSPPDIDLRTKEEFNDFKLHVEFKMDPGSNSGIYLRGRYEVQLLEDYGKGSESHGNGAVYSRIAPAKNASKPAGEWQTFDITLIGRWVTVVLNGETIIDNQHLDGITGGALDSFEWMPGPIMFQGDHGRVWFRKVVITPALD